MCLEIAVVSTLMAVGQVLLGHFEEKTPRWKLLLKLAVALGLAVTVSSLFGRVAFWILLLLLALPAVYIHGWWLPSKGIDGWTAEPKDKYYALRGWSKSRPGARVRSSASPSSDE